jgi:hypothetical protein
MVTVGPMHPPSGLIRLSSRAGWTASARRQTARRSLAERQSRPKPLREGRGGSVYAERAGKSDRGRLAGRHCRSLVAAPLFPAGRHAKRRDLARLPGGRVTHRINNQPLCAIEQHGVSSTPGWFQRSAGAHADPTRPVRHPLEPPLLVRDSRRPGARRGDGDRNRGTEKVYHDESPNRPGLARWALSRRQLGRSV